MYLSSQIMDSFDCCARDDVSPDNYGNAELFRRLGGFSTQETTCRKKYKKTQPTSGLVEKLRFLEKQDRFTTCFSRPVEQVPYFEGWGMGAKSLGVKAG